MISEQATVSRHTMHDLLRTNPSKPLARTHAIVNLSGLLLVAVVLLLPVQAGSLLAAPTGHAPGAPVAAAHATPTVPASQLTLPATLRTSVLERVNAALHSTSAWPTPAERVSGLTTAQTGAPAASPSGSTSTNFQLPSSDCSSWGSNLYIPFFGGENTVQVGASASDLLAGASSMNDMYNGTGGTACIFGGSTISPSSQFFTNGLASSWRSTDGGVTWTETPIPRNVSHWQTLGDPTYGAVTSGPSVVAAGSNGVAIELTGYAPACAIDPLLNCTGPSGLQAPWGFAVSRSSDGGLTWTNATQLDQETALKWIPFPSTCTTPFYFPNNLPERPWIVTDGTNAVAGWDVFHYNWDPTNCTRLSQAFVQVVYSTDGGVTWSGPLNISNPVSDSISVAMGPASTHTEYAVFADFLNASTTTGQYAWAIVKSTDHGATWSTESDLGPAFVNPESGTSSAPDIFASAQFPVLAADNWSSSPHSGNLYLVWEDNQTGTYAGISAIAYLRSTNGGASWGSVSYLTAQTASTSYLQPAIAVGPDGTVWVTYLGVGTSSGNYNLYGIYSKDGGATWSHQFVITDTPSAPGTTIKDLGFNMGVAATSNGAVPIWPDCRAANCLTNGDVTLMTAQVGATNVTTNAPGAVSATVTEFGATSTYTTPAATGWDAGASITAQVPQNVAYNATYIDSFSTWAGASTSGNFRTTFTYSGTGNLTALYSPVPAAFFAGNITPNIAGVVLTVDGQSVPLTSSGSQLTYSTSVASGTAYWLNASAPLYVPQNRQVSAVGGQTTYVNFALQRETGTITGILSPVNASLTLDNVSVSAQVNTTTKIFTLVVPWGGHWLNASLTGYATQSAYLTVTAGGVVNHNFYLSGGWIAGTVKGATSTLVLRIDGALQATLAGTFNVSVAGGFHTLAATQKGYNLSQISNIGVIPGHTTFVNVTLTNLGWITGTISPTAALTKSLELKITNGTQGGPEQYSTTTGLYNVSVKGGYNWTVYVQASGYNSTSKVVYVSAGNGTSLDIALNLTPTTGCTTNCPPPPPNGGGNTSSSGIPLTTVLIIVVVIVVVAVIAIVLMMRRRGGGGGGDGSEMPPGPDQTYAGTNPEDLPKLQSDGSMGGGSNQ